jgi:LmbE family N-acetylglucosaminyl deacetylase
MTNYICDVESSTLNGALIFSQLRIPTSDKLYIFSPHPDDLSISLGGLAILASQAGVPIHSILMTDGSEAAIPEQFLAQAQGAVDALTPPDPKRLRGKIRVRESREEALRLGLGVESVILLNRQTWFTRHRTPADAMNADGSIRDVNRFRPGPITPAAIEEIASLLGDAKGAKVLCAVPAPLDRQRMHALTPYLVVKALRPLARRDPDRFSLLIYRCLSTAGWPEGPRQRILGFNEKIMTRKCHAIQASESMKARRAILGGYANQGHQFYDTIIRIENSAAARRHNLKNPYAECFHWCKVSEWHGRAAGRAVLRKY